MHVAPKSINMRFFFFNIPGYYFPLVSFYQSNRNPKAIPHSFKAKTFIQVCRDEYIALLLSCFCFQPKLHKEAQKRLLCLTTQA